MALGRPPVDFRQASDGLLAGLRWTFGRPPVDFWWPPVDFWWTLVNFWWTMSAFGGIREEIICG
nr:MAG TPA: hypothetical protein [Caudoviricetes sp.]